MNQPVIRPTDPQRPKVKSKSEAGTVAAELALTVIMLGFITSGLIGGAHLMGFLSDIPARLVHWVGATIIAYVVVATATVVHLGVKFILKKG